MRILFVVTCHNGLSQRLQCELEQESHIVEIAIFQSADQIEKVVEQCSPDLIIAPFLKSPLPDTVWRQYLCLIVHPGIIGDRGPSSLDWAIMKEEPVWGVTVLQADEKMDAGDIWASKEFERREVSKSNLYRHQVTEAATVAVKHAIANFQLKNFKPRPLDYADADVRGQWNNPIKRKDRHFEWSDTSAQIIRKIKAADSTPGLLETRIFDEEYFMYGAHHESLLKGNPGEIIAKRDGAICIGTGDGSVWISHLKKKRNGIKRKAALLLGDQLDHLPESPLDAFDAYNNQETFREIWVEQNQEVCFINFDFYNGAMSSHQCNRLRKVFMQASQMDCSVIVLKGGADLWSNGIDLNEIECADNPADESWDNIVAIDDLTREIINCESKLVISAMSGNAGAGGAILALAADFVFARAGIVLNPHYKNMGLYGSEYWTYLLPKRVGGKKAKEIMNDCVTLVAEQAKEIGFVEECLAGEVDDFSKQIGEKALALARHSGYKNMIAQKRTKRLKDETEKSLDRYRNEELSEMQKIFYDPESAYHLQRHFFVHKIGQKDQQENEWEINNFKGQKRVREPQHV
ncbi:Methionyl-tRNA formyltransferase [Reichenbachiella faecimaris]|uniref:Methionyl-tRNA formyltransferase n=1 Tax=Reichenbachiella faecimaris TaxID=692418 RepID=A0A1W2GPH3_REIFA|nr:hydrogenase maturation protein [Reichenbachiella faecimaris]SMD38342.1 Methionyl-tRNA formyltransferase [Reichenbachiella faecimaris]